MDDDFEKFWSAYPLKVGKLAAQRAYVKARKTVTFEVLLAGVERYKVNKPRYADWCQPKTWLTQGRWLDEYETALKPDIHGHFPPCARWDECIQRVISEGRVARANGNT